uniref:BTB-POZ domain-containing protein n=1 Tax=Clandestinovirus TaxID=2831644 RepID=A0A8F8KQD1_9VIRU|nr:BTB-POZ domain-containing protein [Clandestinovirus]
MFPYDKHLNHKISVVICHVLCRAVIILLIIATMSKDPLLPVLKLNVSGRLFYIKTSLVMSKPDLPLAKMFNGQMERPYMLDDGFYYIESHPDCFESVLNCYRYGYLEKPDTVHNDLFVSEAIYWGLMDADVKDAVNQANHGPLDDYFGHQEGSPEWEDERPN